jgi:hypothetical protein
MLQSFTMSRRATNHNGKGITMGTKRPKSSLSKRRIKARARVKQVARHAEVLKAMAKVPMFV